MNQKEKMYIFLDVDGVLNNTAWFIKYKEENLAFRGFDKDICPSNIAMLKQLIKELNRDFDVDVVVSSTWRANMDKLSWLLKHNGLEYEKPLLRTTFDKNRNRANEIGRFIIEHDVKRYVIIDDDTADLKKVFASNDIIKTNIHDGGLKQEHINKYLSNNNHLYDDCEK